MSLQYLIQALREERKRQKEDPMLNEPFVDRLKQYGVLRDYRDQCKALVKPCDTSQRR